MQENTTNEAAFVVEFNYSDQGGPPGRAGESWPPPGLVRSEDAVVTCPFKFLGTGVRKGMNAFPHVSRARCLQAALQFALHPVFR
jgi:hypothetical protein